MSLRLNCLWNWIPHIASLTSTPLTSLLHRSHRRVNFGNATHVTIRVAVDENNKANLYVSLDRSDRSYFGCDAGCLDAPVKLG